MSFEYRKLKHDKSSIIPIEEIYTDLDINPNDPYIPNVGYRFDTPRRWSNDGSKNKSIGIRDLHLTPSSGDIRCRFISFANIAYITFEANWVDEEEEDGETIAAHYELDKDSIEYQDFNPQISFQTISDIYNVQITPENGFEEIITSMINFINGPTWKGFEVPNVAVHNFYKPRERQKGRNGYYFKEELDSDDESGEDYHDLSALSFIMNINSLKIPIAFNYVYDSNTSDFSIKPNNELRILLMKSVSKSDNDTELGDRPIDPIEGSYLWSDAATAEERFKNAQNNPLDNINCYLPRCRLFSAELLLIIEKSDIKSIKAVYDLFNQKMPNDVEDLPSINIEEVIYVIPFLSCQDIKNGIYKSRFNIGFYDKDTAKNKYINGNRMLSTNNGLPGFRTNLKLNNVWDRLHLIYHASFAETRHRIIGRNNDHWDTPNKMFIVPGGDQDQFYLRFTTDGTHNILPIGCRFNVDLTFMLNPTKNTSTGIQGGNHDSFKD